MAESKKLVPKRRFKEFQNADAWKQRKLDNEVIITMGQSPDGSTYSDVPSDHILVQGNADLKNGWVFPRVWTTQVTKKADAGDLIMSVRAPAGEMGKTAYNVVLGRGVAAIKGNEFIFQNLVQMNDNGYWKKLSSGSTFDSLNSENIRSTEIMVPNSKEQEKIGDFFKNVDNLITLHQRKLEKTKALKAAFLFEMFPAQGESVPKRRFAGFTGAWEQRRVNDIAEFSKGNGYSKGDLLEVGTPIILYGRLYTKYQFMIDDIDTYVEIKGDSVFSRGNEVIVPASGETAKDIVRASAVVKSGILLGGDLNIIHPYDYINPMFLALVISNSNTQKELAKKAQGKSVVHIHNSDIQKVTIHYPKKEEQDQIVNVFTRLDNLITLHQCKLEKLQDIKKAYLNEMFI